jgi:RNA recognition motif-containing protein
LYQIVNKNIYKKVMDSKKLFIGNVTYSTTIETLVEQFMQFGEITDSYKPQGKGFAFITFATEEQAQAAIEGMNGKEVDGRELVVNVAKPREDKPRRNFGGNGGDRRGGFNQNRDYNRNNRY